MAAVKSRTLTLRIEPALKKALDAAAKAEHRSVTNMVEVLIRDHCKRQGIAIVNGASSVRKKRAAKVAPAGEPLDTEE
jgi:hypothetical protein